MLRVTYRNVHLDNTGDVFLNLLQLSQLVLGLGVVGRCHDHASHQGAALVFCQLYSYPCSATDTYRGVMPFPIKLQVSNDNYWG